MGEFLTCTRAGVYPLTRGRRYEVLARATKKEQIRVRADHGRSRWFPTFNFAENDAPVPVLTKWVFDDPVVDELNGWDNTNNFVNVVVWLDDGTQRWCMMVTPDYLKALLTPRPSQPMIYAKNLIIVRDLATETVDQVLRHLDQQGELIEFTKPVRNLDLSDLELDE